MELIESGRNPFISESSKLDCTGVIKSATAQSPNLRCHRHQIPFRSLENTDLIESSNSTAMVCSENVDDVHLVCDHKQAQITKVSQDSNSCPDVSSHGCSYQKISFSRSGGKQLSTSTPNGLNQHMTRSTNCPLSVDADCIYQNEENIKLDNADKSGIRIRTDPFTDHYVVEKEIGRGKFAVVKKCHHKTSGLKYAAKFLRKRRKGKDCRGEILKEIKMLEIAGVHPRLINMTEVFETSHEMIIITEYAEGGELFQRVVVDENFDEQETRRLLRQILEGVLFLHEHSIVHLDIKPQNILLTGTGPKSNIKLCDLGFARPINSGDDVRDIIGTPDYVAPEILSYEPIHIGSDMWSIGVLTYVILTGCSPFAGDNKQETFLNISQVNVDFPSELFGDISKGAIDFISKLLVRNPEKRMTARECLNHPWLQITTAGSPIGQRRALTPPSPDTLPEEPLKKCRCDAAISSPSTSCSHSCESRDDPDDDDANDSNEDEVSTQDTNSDQISGSEEELYDNNKEHHIKVSTTTTITDDTSHQTASLDGSTDQ